MGKDLNGKELGIGLYQRKDGRYEARYTDRYGKTKSVYNKSLRAVKAEKKRLEREERFAEPVATHTKQITLNEWANTWLETYKCHVSPSTQLRYQRGYLNHVAPTLGEKDITEINNADITRLLNTLGCKLRIQTIKFVKTILNDMFKKAQLNDLINRNPVAETKAVGLSSKERKVLTKSEQDQFVLACQGHIYEYAYIVALHTGLRCGELFALRWNDIDFEARKINVTRSLSYRMRPSGKSEYQIDVPKTKTSVRSVYFDEICADAFRHQFAKRSEIIQSPLYNPLVGFEDLLFVTKYGTPICNNFVDKAIKYIVARYNENHENECLKSFGIHTLRHTYASRCFEAGIPPKIIQAQLGHASLNMTMDIYTHIFDDHRQQEIAKLDQFYLREAVGQNLVK